MTSTRARRRGRRACDDEKGASPPNRWGRPVVKQRETLPFAERVSRKPELLGLDGGDLDLQDDLVGDHDAGVQRGLPVDAEVLAVDGARGGQADALQVVGVDVGALELDVEIDGLGDALDGQVAGQDALVVAGDLGVGGDEGDLRVLLDLEEIAGADVAVTVGVAGVDGRGLDDDVGGVVDVLRIDGEGTGVVGELAAGLGTIAWRTMKPSCECDGSMSQVPAKLGERAMGRVLSTFPGDTCTIARITPGG